MATRVALSSKHRADHADGVVGLTVLAVLLALTLGLSAADIQHRRVIDAQATISGNAASTILNGRGKWAGYANPTGR